MGIRDVLKSITIDRVDPVGDCDKSVVIGANSRWRLARVTGEMLPVELLVEDAQDDWVRANSDIGWHSMSRAYFLSHYAPVDVVDDPEDGD